MDQHTADQRQRRCDRGDDARRSPGRERLAREDFLDEAVSRRGSARARGWRGHGGDLLAIGCYGTLDAGRIRSRSSAACAAPFGQRAGAHARPRAAIKARPVTVRTGALTTPAYPRSRRARSGWPPARGAGLRGHEDKKPWSRHPLHDCCQNFATAPRDVSVVRRHARRKRLACRHFRCARVDSNHHGPYGPQGPQPCTKSVDTSRRAEIVHTVQILDALDNMDDMDVATMLPRI